MTRQRKSDSAVVLTRRQKDAKYRRESNQKLRPREWVITRPFQCPFVTAFGDQSGIFCWYNQRVDPCNDKQCPLPLLQAADRRTK